MKIREFKTELWLPVSPAELFPFFSNAANLDAITPPWLHFQILTPSPSSLQEGSLIDYCLRLHGIPIRWRTRIKVWQPPYLFIDEQLRGPYRQWIHEHRFEPENDGTIAKDQVRYAVPFDVLVHNWLVLPDIQRIFRFRAQILRKRFDSRR